MTTRRDFLKVTAMSGAALVVGVRLGEADEPSKPWKANAWVRVDGDGGITVIIGKQEMGQGVRTSLAMIVAEELDADWGAIRVEQASTGADYKRLGTGGSTSLWGQWKPLRQAGAAARDMLVRAAAAEWKVAPSEVRTEKGFLLCGTKRAAYGAFAAAASKLEPPKEPALKSMKDFRIVGKRTKRIDGPAIVSGKAKYGLDTRVPGMKFATVLRAPAVGGSVARFDATNARKVRGVRDVVAIPNAVAVIADNTWAAMKARGLVDIEWNAGPNASFDSAAYIDSLIDAAKREAHPMRTEGDFAGARKKAAKTLEAVYVYPFYVHAPVETQNCIARIRDGKCEIWAPTQAPNRVADFVAKQLGVNADDVTVHPTLIGGGFGRRLAADYAVEAAEVSKAIGGAPVQVVWSRDDDMKHGHLQHATAEAMRGALDADGNVVGWSHTKVTNPIMSTSPPPNAEQMQDLTAFYIDRSWGVYDVPYAIPHVATGYIRVDSPVRYGPWRAVYSPSSTMARECFLDELAHAADRDPLQLRLDLLQGDRVRAGELTLDRARLRRVLETVRDRSNWGKRPGQGLACNIYDGDTHIAYVVEVSDAGSIERIVCAVDCGPVVNPTGVEQQIEGGVIWAIGQLMTQITIKDGAVEQSSYADYAVPRISDAPPIEIHILPSTGDQPFGMGEPPVPPLVPAFLNALFAATGRRVRRLPLPGVG